MRAASALKAGAEAPEVINGSLQRSIDANDYATMAECAPFVAFRYQRTLQQRPETEILSLSATTEALRRISS
jgi:hypothetical protein